MFGNAHSLKVSKLLVSRAGRAGAYNDMAERSGDLAKAALAVAAEHDADVIFYSGPIDDAGFGEVAKAIARAKHHSKAILILTTNGGQANSAYQIARLFQKTYDEFWIYTPSYCKSAGTIIALGAHTLLMDSFSELGPLDVQLMKENEIFARKSGLLSRSSFESLQEISFELYEQFMLRITAQSGGHVSFRLASELSAKMASNLMAPIYGQINPDIVGSDYRDLNVALHYGQRLINFSRNADINTVTRLVKDYPSHDFIIDDIEAQELFKKVETPSQPMYELIALIGEPAYSEQREPDVRALTLAKDFAKEKDDGKGHDSAEAQPSTPGSLDSGGREDRSGNTEQTEQNLGDRVTRLPTAQAGE